MKIRIITDEDDVYIVPYFKTEWKNTLNHHKYLNDKKGNNIKILHKRNNWKDISNLCLERIKLPENTKSLNDVQYTDLILEFRDKQDNIITFSLEDATSGLEVEEILTKLLTPDKIRTDYPRGYTNNHFLDFITTIIYELYSNVPLIDSLISQALYPQCLHIGNNEYCFKINNVTDNSVTVAVTTEGEPADINDWNWNPVTSKTSINGIECNLGLAVTSNADNLLEEYTDKEIEITGINFTDNQITLIASEDLFHKNNGTMLILFGAENTVTKEKIIIPVTHQCRLVNSLGIPLEIQGTNTPSIPVIDQSLAQNTITTQKTAENSGITQIPLGTTIIDQTNATYYQIVLDEDQNLNVYKVTSNGEKTWIYTVNNQTEQETLNTNWSRETDAETGDPRRVLSINSEMGLTPKQVEDDTNFKLALTDYINLDNLYKLGHTVSILPNRGGGLINNFPMVHWNTNPTIKFNAENSAEITIPLGNTTWNTTTNTSYTIIKTSNGGMNILRTNHTTGEHQLILPTQSTPPATWTGTPSLKTSISRETDPETGDRIVVIGEWRYSEGNNLIGRADDNELGQLLWDIYLYPTLMSMP